MGAGNFWKIFDEGRTEAANRDLLDPADAPCRRLAQASFAKGTKELGQGQKAEADRISTVRWNALNCYFVLIGAQTCRKCQDKGGKRRVYNAQSKYESDHPRPGA